MPEYAAPAPDHAAWNRLKAGDVTALGELYDTHASSLLQFGSRICYDRGLVRDAIQDVFVELWQYHARLADVRNGRFYLFRMLRSHLSRHLARRGQSVEFFDESGAGEAVSTEELLIAGETDELQKHRLQAALRELTPRQRQAVLLRFYENFSYDEIAELMGISYQGVVNLIYKSTQRLRQHLPGVAALVGTGLALAQWVGEGLVMGVVFLSGVLF